MSAARSGASGVEIGSSGSLGGNDETVSLIDGIAVAGSGCERARPSSIQIGSESTAITPRIGPTREGGGKGFGAADVR